MLLGLLPALCPAGEPVRVAALGTVLADLARQVGGAGVEVVGLVEPGEDPHGFEPTPGDLRRLGDAEVVLLNGLGLENNVERLRAAASREARFVVAGEVIEPLVADGAACEHPEHDHAQAEQAHAEQESAHGHHAVDPHWWGSPANARAVVVAIRDALAGVRPSQRAEFERNAAAALVRLAALQDWIEVQVASVPRPSRVLVSSHDAFRYFARDFGFETVPIHGLSMEDQPSAQEVAALIQRLRSGGVRAIFAEAGENPEVLEAMMRESGVRLGGRLHADGLGAAPADTYEGMMRQNVEVLVGGLRP